LPCRVMLRERLPWESLAIRLLPTLDRCRRDPMSGKCAVIRCFATCRPDKARSLLTWRSTGSRPR
jgi:hypothetical protein